MSFGPINEQTDLIITLLKDSKNIETIISIDGSPFYVILKRAKCELFLLASTKMIDIETEITLNNLCNNSR